MTHQNQIHRAPGNQTKYSRLVQTPNNPKFLYNNLSEVLVEWLRTGESK